MKNFIIILIKILLQFIIGLIEITYSALLGSWEVSNKIIRESFDQIMNMKNSSVIRYKEFINQRLIERMIMSNLSLDSITNPSAGIPHLLKS